MPIVNDGMLLEFVCGSSPLNGFIAAAQDDAGLMNKVLAHKAGLQSQNYISMLRRPNGRPPSIETGTCDRIIAALFQACETPFVSATRKRMCVAGAHDLAAYQEAARVLALWELRGKAIPDPRAEFRRALAQASPEIAALVYQMAIAGLYGPMPTRRLKPKRTARAFLPGRPSPFQQARRQLKLSDADDLRRAELLEQRADLVDGHVMTLGKTGQCGRRAALERIVVRYEAMQEVRLPSAA